MLETFIISSITFAVYLVAFRIYTNSQMKKTREKQIKAYREFQSKLKVGQDVIFGGGLRGKVVQLEDEWATVELLNKNKIQVLKGSITDIL